MKTKFSKKAKLSKKANIWGTIIGAILFLALLGILLYIAGTYIKKKGADEGFGKTFDKIKGDLGTALEGLGKNIQGEEATTTETFKGLAADGKTHHPLLIGSEKYYIKIFSGGGIPNNQVKIALFDKDQKPLDESPAIPSGTYCFTKAEVCLTIKNIKDNKADIAGYNKAQMTQKSIRLSDHGTKEGIIYCNNKMLKIAVSPAHEFYERKYSPTANDYIWFNIYDQNNVEIKCDDTRDDLTLCKSGQTLSCPDNIKLNCGEFDRSSKSGTITCIN